MPCRSNTTTDKRHTPHSFQTFDVARNCNHEIDMAKGNVAIRMFQSIFHRSLCRYTSHHVKRTNPTATTGRNTTNQSTGITELYHEQCRNNKIESCSPTHKVEKNLRYCNRTTISFGLDNGEMNHDNLYVSPVTYRRKLSIKGLGRGHVSNLPYNHYLLNASLVDSISNQQYLVFHAFGQRHMQYYLNW